MKSSLLVAVGLVFATLASAQAERRSLGEADMQERLKADVEIVIELLELEGEAADTVRAVLTARNQKLADIRTRLRDSGRITEEELREVVETINRETSEALAKLLTEEQMTRYQEYRKNQRANRSRGRY